MTSVSGAVVWSAKYGSFGEASVEVESVENCLRFPGQYWDGETGLHYNWFRYYNSILGRYVRTDPLGLKGGINLFTYTNCNPINYNDFYGLTTYRSDYAGINQLIAAGNYTDAADLAALAGFASLSAYMASKHYTGDIPSDFTVEDDEEDCDDDDFCYKRWEEESLRCSQWADYKDWGAVSGCQERAAIRRNMCVSNGGSPNPDEPPEWSVNDIY